MPFIAIIMIIQDQSVYPVLGDMQTLNSSSARKNINHKNARLNASEYYLGKRCDADATGDDGDDRDGGQSPGYRKPVVDNVNSKTTKPLDNVNRKYDESAFSRCALLFIGALCQQGKRCNVQNFFRVIFYIMIHSYSSFRRAVCFILHLYCSRWFGDRCKLLKLFLHNSEPKSNIFPHQIQSALYAYRFNRLKFFAKQFFLSIYLCSRKEKKTFSPHDLVVIGMQRKFDVLSRGQYYHHRIIFTP